MMPFYFGAGYRRLFGVFQPAQGAASASTAVLLCNPFGQEAVRAHRMYRVLADRLTRAGVAVLRFDYFATGDSAGQDVDGELVGWTNDLISAHVELLQRSGSTRVCWLGTRLGATLAIKAAAATSHRPEQLTLWEPIVDGPAYLRELANRHVQTLHSSYNVPEPSWRRNVDSGAMDLEREGVGFELGTELRAQLLELSPRSLPAPRISRCAVIEQGDQPAAAEMLNHWRSEGVAVNEVKLPHDFDWLAAEALDTALVPAVAIQVLRQLVTMPP